MSRDLTEDDFLGGRLRLRQPVKGHRAGHDAILLAAATEAVAGERVVELGAGIGTAGLALARRAAVELTLVEIDEGLAALARENAELNGIACRVVVLDVAAKADAFVAAALAPDSVDHVLMNPPFNDPARHQPSPDKDRRTAHEARSTTLETWIHAARRLLKPGGTLTLIWRAEALSDILAALGRGFGGIAVLPVHPKCASPAIRVLVQAEKGSGAPLTLRPGLMLNGDSGRPTPHAEKVLRGEETLRFGRN
jgi:tRNA1(Val) A37 N6-methylase TrmN6